MQIVNHKMMQNNKKKKKKYWKLTKNHFIIDKEIYVLVILFDWKL